LTGESPRADLELQVLDVVERIVASLPPGTADLAVEETGPSMTARIEPSNPGAAEVAVHVESGVPVIDVILGKGGFFEVSTERSRFSDLEEPLDEVRALCLAAVRGNYRETIRLKGDEVVSSRGIVTIGSREEPVRWKQLFTNPFRRSVHRVLRYEPYVGDEEGEKD